MHPSSQYLMRPVKSVKDPLGILAFKFDCHEADGDAIIDGAASAASAQVLTAEDFVSADPIGKPGSFVTFTFSSHANWDATTAVFTGEDAAGRIVSENVSIPNGGNVTRVSSKRYVRPISLEIPAQSGTSGTVDVGWANRVDGPDIPIPVGIVIPSVFDRIDIDVKIPDNLVRAVLLHVQEIGADPVDDPTVFSPKWSMTDGVMKIWAISHGSDETDVNVVAQLSGMTVSLLVLFEA